uniref:Uncharacterized protein n=1 Tax=Heterorhabditis bacteriophora TaxID=37862 RepID=A0A1I7X7T6_HETBA
MITSHPVMALWCRSYGVGREGQDRFRLSAKKCSRIPHVPYCPTRPVDSSAAVVILCVGKVGQIW